MVNLGLIAENEELNQRLRDMHDDILLIKERQESALKLIKKHDEVLYGNGKIGLITSFAVLKREAGFIGAGVALVVTTVLNMVLKK